MKAMLIMDMPSSCSTCQLCVPSQEKHTGQFCWKCTIYPTMMIAKRKMNARQEYCPLREVPQKKEVKSQNEVLEIVKNGGDLAKETFEALTNYGYNACIDEILGGGE